MARKRASRPAQADVPIQLPPSVRELLGPAESTQLLHALAEASPVSLRCNPQKPMVREGTPVLWCSSGRYLDQRPAYTLDPRLHGGAYYVQEPSSMLLEQALKAAGPFAPDTLALDLCAAPGGKSTHLAALLPPEALLVCNEPVRERRSILMENLWKWGRPDVIVTGDRPDAFTALGPFFHLVLVDAPCSGEGMFRKAPFARAQWSEALVAKCAALQRNILDVAWALLHPGGTLIYSTCTWERQENEDQMQRLMEQGAELVAIPVDPTWGVSQSDAGLRCWPHRVRGEGFFIAALRKPGTAGARTPHSSTTSIFSCGAEAWLNDQEAISLKRSEDVVHALRERWRGDAERLEACVHVAAPGIPVALRKGKGWAPHPALALNGLLDREAFPTLELDEAEALRYLRGEALPAQHAKGPVLVIHEDLPLGWAMGAGNRWNNGWPAGWRIRKR